MPETEAMPLVNLGLIGANPAVVNEDNLLGYAATENAIVNLELYRPKALTPIIAEKFISGTGFVPPAPKANQRKDRKGKAEKRYPFATMKLTDFFFVPATEDAPNPAKKLASTVSSANTRYKNTNRMFKIFRAQEGDVFGSIVTERAGAYVVCMERPVEDEVADAS